VHDAQGYRRIREARLQDLPLLGSARVEVESAPSSSESMSTSPKVIAFLTATNCRAGGPLEGGNQS
jgi:hypothetical protein